MLTEISVSEDSLMTSFNVNQNLKQILSDKDKLEKFYQLFKINLNLPSNFNIHPNLSLAPISNHWEPLAYFVSLFVERVILFHRRNLLLNFLFHPFQTIQISPCTDLGKYMWTFISIGSQYSSDWHKSERKVPRNENNWFSYIRKKWEKWENKFTGWTSGTAEKF